MDAIEKAIRNAFEKGNPRERPFREQVYRSAFAALDRALKANPNVTQEMVSRRRQMLTATIYDIESEFVQAAPAGQPTEPQVEAAAPSGRPDDAQPGPTPAVDPAIDRPESSFDAAPAPEPRGGTTYGDSGFDDEIEPQSNGAYRPQGRRGRPWAILFVAATLLSAVGIGAWWAIDSGLFMSPSERDGSVPNPPQTVEEEDFTPEAPAEPDQRPVFGGDSLADWIVVFEPSDPTTVAAPGDSRAEVLEEEGDQFIRITSGASGSPVLFDVGQGVLERIAGKRAVFNIVARAQEGQETQISVDCNLGELGDCGRKRYAVGVTREEFLFEMNLPAIDPGAGGTIAINPDIGDSGKSVDVYAIRVSAAD